MSENHDKATVQTTAPTSQFQVEARDLWRARGFYGPLFGWAIAPHPTAYAPPGPA